ncbi:MAG: mevalonate kinase [Candidatus Pacebacteria bacterium RIFOXYB1_FULL_39_46]|nr:MAG: mevalonate kinase [Candidatus Pacebacteria bacterium RIFOXYA1_FULL_38_18]OGJ38086.1 MAG: mevalonate kinase [Candidatus Pacebacteria bacterium RIFOXYB1_FULL_39_46]OGJ39691.1 MAG: mevalonate kinase [Candidatus Pacebacteria bacterium RIFOXYC1_FULL_39_21]OGJ39838.1 MAG: mevalonate kinase [Candidatus Pacebacteria bacterium RIFOXYD1_FULL_39_27]
MNKIQASAPGKLMLFGEHAVVYGHPCIVTAVDQRIFVEVQKKDNHSFSVVAPEVGVDKYTKSLIEIGKATIPRSVVFLEKLYKKFIEKYSVGGGIQVTTRSEFSAKFGFGSSSAVTVAFAKALTKLFAIELSKKELFDLCYQTVIDVQGVGSGFDLASAIWGGTIYYIKPAKIVEQLSEKEIPISVAYTGIKADTTSLVKMVAEEKANNADKINEIFEQITIITKLAKTAILASDWPQVGNLMTQNQLLLAELGVSSTELDSLISVSLLSGAYGAKLSGAGGGDCMIALADQKIKKKMEIELENVGGQVLQVHTGADAVRLETESKK